MIDHDELAEALTASSSTFGHSDILRAVAERAHQGATVVQVEASADAFLVGQHVVRLADGVYTTREMLRLERGSSPTPRHDWEPGSQW